MGHNGSQDNANLGVHCHEQMGPGSSGGTPIQRLDPQQLITPARLDLITKISYARELIFGKPTNATSSEYKRLARCMANITPARQGTKIRRPEESEASYQRLIRSIVQRGYDHQNPILLGEDGSIVDGAHRIAIMEALAMEISAKRVMGRGRVCDACWFRQQGLSTSFTEDLLVEMTTYLSDACIFLLWPAMNHAQKAESVRILRSKARSIIYLREDTFQLAALHALSALAYAEEDWVGSVTTGFDGALVKAKQVLGSRHSRLTTILADISAADAQIAKNAIRVRTGLGNDGVHCTDSKEEALLLAQVLLDQKGRNKLGFGYRFHATKAMRRFLQNGLPFLPGSHLHRECKSESST